MSVINLLSSSLGQKSNDANIALAKKIAATKNHESIKELVHNLNHNKDKKIQSDCIKVIYETAYIKAEMIAEYYSDLINLLTKKNNRLVWGAMIALSKITDFKHKEIFNSFKIIKETVEKGSVITIDCGIEILAKLNKHSEYNDTVEPFLIELLWECPIKQLPQYLEKSLISITDKNKEIYHSIIDNRINECDKESQKKRLEKILKKIN